MAGTSKEESDFLNSHLASSALEKRAFTHLKKLPKTPLLFHGDKKPLSGNNQDFLLNKNNYLAKLMGK